ncbi:MAG: hypothetical protein WCW17_03120 [Patescibacteria group bacterium]|jgi:diacylglycerol kinase family enzyme
MYYYIVELSKETGGIKFLDKIKNSLSDLGISGETVVPTAARTAEELALMGIDKGYSTIVTIGSGKLINRVASILQDNHEITMGIVPTDSTSQLHQMIGSKDIDSAIRILKSHNIQYINLAHIEPSRYFLNKAYIYTPRPININFQIDNDYKGAAIITELNFTSDLKLELENVVEHSFLDKIKHSFSKSSPKLMKSTFTAKNRVIITTLKPLPVISEKEIIAQTPITLTCKKQVLKIITNHDTI